MGQEDLLLEVEESSRMMTGARITITVKTNSDV